MTDERGIRVALGALEAALGSVRVEAVAVADAVDLVAAPIRARLEALSLGSTAAELEVAVARCHAAVASWEAQAARTVEEELTRLRPVLEPAMKLSSSSGQRAHRPRVETGQDKLREDTERAWVRGVAIRLFGGIGAAFGREGGAMIGELGGQLALEGILQASDERAQRVQVMKLTGLGHPASAVAPKDLAGILRRISSARKPGGTIRIDQLRRTDGSELAMVYIPGVGTWMPGTTNPADVSSAFGAVAGADSAWRQTVLSSLREAGVSKDVPVVLAGHSLGAHVALDMAADPYIRAEFNVHSVVTAGVGGGQFTVPEHITVISVRRVHDPAGLVGGTRAETSVEVRGGWVWGSPHSAKSYTALAEVSHDPRVGAWHSGLGLARDVSGTSSWYRGTVREPA